METRIHPYPELPTRVIHVGGSDYDIGRMHAEQIGAICEQGMVEFYYRFWKRMSSKVPEQGFEKIRFLMGKFFLEKVLMKRLQNTLPDGLVQRLRGFSDQSKIPLEKLWISAILPDLLPMLEAYVASWCPDVVVRARPQFGCSSFISKGKHFLVGRNLDFPGVAFWDRYPVIQVTAKKNSLKYIEFTTSGVPLCGISGVNEAQITVALHQHYAKETSFRGVPPYVVGEAILSSAKTLEDAKKVILSFSLCSSWAFVIADGKSKDAFILEAHPKGFGISSLADHANVLTHSNHFQTPSCQPIEYAATERMNWDNFSRKQRLNSLIRGYGFHLTPEEALKALSDHFDPYLNEEKIINRTVSQVYNIQSYLLDPVNLTLYLAEGPCPLHLRRYREYDLKALFSGRNGQTESFHSAYSFNNDHKRNAKEEYILSFVAGCNGESEKALKGTETSLQYDYCPEVALTSAILSLQLGDFKNAYEKLSRAKSSLDDKIKLKNIKFPPEYFEILIFLARTSDLLGRRLEAIGFYHLIASHADCLDSRIRRLAHEATPYTQKGISKILMPYSSYIPFQ